MKARWVTTLLLTAMVGLGLQPLLVKPSRVVAQPASPTSVPARSVIISELMPAPDGGSPEWAELVNLSRSSWVNVPLVLRHHGPGAGSSVWPGLPSPDALASPGSGLDLSGWQVCDEDGNVYTIPAVLGPVPPGAYVLTL